MKKSFFMELVLGMAMVSSPSLLAQSFSSVHRGDTVVLTSVSGYDNYQWQVSSDLRNFVDFPEGKVQNLSLKVNAPAYYRVKVTDQQNQSLFLDTLNVTLEEVNYHKDFSVSGGGHGYVETTKGEPHASGIKIPEDRVDGIAGTTKKLTEWVNGDAMAVYYFHHPAAVVDTEMYLKVKSGQKVSFRVKVFDPERMDTPIACNIIAITGTGAEQKVYLVSAEFPRENYFRYQIECLNGWNSIIEISKFHHYSPSDQPTYKAAFRSSPSLHIWGWRCTDPKAPNKKGHPFDWSYEEVMIPKSSDVIGTYAVSLGVLSGYMGIQVNGYDSEGRPIHGTLFSQWDDGSTDKDPNLPLYLRTEPLDHGEDVVVKRFGGEGTGVQSFKRGQYWEAGKYVQFICNCRPEKYVYYVEENGKEVAKRQDNLLVSAWFNAQDGRGWQYMSTMRIRNKVKMIDGWYSFLENYNAATGQVERKAYYRNGYARARSNHKWYHCNKVSYTHTDGGTKIGARNDYSFGVSEEDSKAFYMSSGGYLDCHKGEGFVPLNTTNTPVDTIDLAALNARIDQAIAHEKALREQEEQFKKNKLNKQDWELIDFSSEEVKGEGKNGRAAQIIDGNLNTYWHPQWKGGAAHFPHHLTVDMKAEHELIGMEILTSGGDRRHIKAFNLYASIDNKNWEKVYTDNEVPNQDKNIFYLDHSKPVRARYLKLEITDGYGTDGDFIRLNEIEVSGIPVQTGIGEVNTVDKRMSVYCLKNELAVSFAEDMDDLSVNLYAVDGTSVFSSDLEQVSRGTTIYVPMSKVKEGVYLLSCRAGGQKYVKSIYWKK